MTTKPTPMDLLAAGYAAKEHDHDATRRAEMARLFRPDERMERLLTIQETDPAAFDRFGPTTLISVGHYKQQRDAAGYGGNDEGNDAP